MLEFVEFVLVLDLLRFIWLCVELLWIATRVVSVLASSGACDLGFMASMDIYELLVKRDFEIVSVLRELVFFRILESVSTVLQKTSQDLVSGDKAFVRGSLSSTCWKLMEDADCDYNDNRNKDMRLMR